MEPIPPRQSIAKKRNVLTRLSLEELDAANVTPEERERLRAESLASCEQPPNEQERRRIQEQQENDRCGEQVTASSGQHVAVQSIPVVSEIIQPESSAHNEPQIEQNDAENREQHAERMPEEKKKHLSMLSQKRAELLASRQRKSGASVLDRTLQTSTAKKLRLTPQEPQSSNGGSLQTLLTNASAVGTVPRISQPAPPTFATPLPLNCHPTPVSGNRMQKFSAQTNPPKPFSQITQLAASAMKNTHRKIDSDTQVSKEFKQQIQPITPITETPPSSSGSFLTSSIEEFLNTPRTTAPNYDQNSFILRNEEIIHDYLIIGNGNSAKAIHSPSRRVFDATPYRKKEAMNILRVMYRVNNAGQYYQKADCEDLCNRVWPKESEFVRVHSDRYVLFCPAELESVHTYATERSDKITEAEVMDIMEQVFRIVNFCHSLGIIVRDLKPRKLTIVTSDGSRKVRLETVQELLVLDDPENDQIRERFLTPAYVPPEVLVLNRETGTYSGKAADIWGMGVLLYMLLIGQYPFYDKTPSGVFRKIRRAVVVFPICNISVKNRCLIASMLNKDVKKRPTSAALLKTDRVTKNPVRCRSKLEIRLFEIQKRIDYLQSYLLKARLSLRSRHSVSRKSLPREAMHVQALKSIIKGLVNEFRYLNRTRNKDIESEENYIRQKLDDRENWSDPVKRMARQRLAIINTSLQREQQQLHRLGLIHPAPFPEDGLEEAHLPCELLLPPEVYPPNRSYHPTHNPVEYRVHNVLKGFRKTRFPAMKIGGRKFIFKKKLRFTGSSMRFTSHQVVPPRIHYRSQKQETYELLNVISKK